MLDAIKSIQAQQLYRVQPIGYDDKSNGKNQKSSEINIFAQNSSSLNRPSIEGSPTLGHSLDLFG